MGGAVGVARLKLCSWLRQCEGGRCTVISTLPAAGGGREREREGGRGGGGGGREGERERRREGGREGREGVGEREHTTITAALRVKKHDLAVYITTGQTEV